MRLRTTDLDKAVEWAKKRDECKEDYHLSTRKLSFHTNGQIVCEMRDGRQLPLVGESVGQMCKILQIPKQWIEVKRDMGDSEHLTESFNRHVKKLTSTGIFVRTIHTKDGQVVRAVFPDSQTMLDIPAALRAVRLMLRKHVSEWQWILIDDNKVSVWGLLDAKWQSKFPVLQGIQPAVFAHTSEDGSTPISAGLGVYRQICENGAVVQDDRFRPLSFHRKESVEGGLLERFKSSLGWLEETAIPAYKTTIRGMKRLVDMPLGPARGNTVQKLRRQIAFPSPLEAGIVTAWEPDENTLFGLWNALTRHATVLATELKQDRAAHALRQVSGKLVTAPPAVHQLLASASNEEMEVAV